MLKVAEFGLHRGQQLQARQADRGPRVDEVEPTRADLASTQPPSGRAGPAPERKSRLPVRTAGT